MNKEIGVLTDALKLIFQDKILLEEFKEIKKGVKCGYIYFPKEYIGKRAKIFIVNENAEADIGKRGQPDASDEVLPGSGSVV